MKKNTAISYHAGHFAPAIYGECLLTDAGS